ncbi:toxin-antitoxin system YwqK family antitoxin [Flavobacterium sp. '19STA2R22 D10 B1']|uniref:toxin-antitoxin system YwqK family antitoxin n=1 Tax=Flavobacterium aerium TaxID=3037261 RepID=UPI00278C7FFA|nr:membrane-binding protein [Flavobacterium sp. '19STA2R22 D10 B1']
MKKYMVLGALLISGVIFAQSIEPKYEVVQQMVKAAYYYDNGQLQQEGFYKDGKLHGKWVAYDVNGNKKSLGEYKDGEKTGKWFFWNDKVLTEVDYSDSRVAQVKNWMPDALANRN